jgi:hypothetical protein
MSGNSHTTFAKRQKERARQQKQADKAQRRAQRKLENQGKINPEKPENVIITYDEEGSPEGLGFHDF